MTPGFVPLCGGRMEISMKKVFNIFVLTVLLSGLMINNAAAVRYLHVDRTDNVKFRDNLQNGDMSDWTVFIPAEKTWSIKDFGDGKALCCTYDAKWNYSVLAADVDEQYTENCVISADFTFVGRTEWSGVMLRAADEDNNYTVVLGRDKDIGFVKLIKRLNSTQWNALTLVDVGANVPKDKSVNLVVEAVDNKISATLDGVEVFSYTDESDPIYKGKVGFLHYYGDTRMKNFTITTLPKAEQTEDISKYAYKRCVDYDESEINDFSDAIFDYYGWEDFGNRNLYFENNNLIITSKDGIAEREAAVSYVRKRFRNEPIEFSASGEEEEYSISFKTAEKYKICGDGGDGYNLRIKKDTLELEKWEKGEKRTLAGVSGDFMPKDRFCGFKIETVQENEALRIKVMSDGKTVIDAEDTQNPITGEGYISIVSYMEELRLKQAPEKILSEKQLLGNAVLAKYGSDKIYIGTIVSGYKVYKSGSAMLPLRKLAAEWGAEVLWNGTEKTADIRYGGKTCKLMKGYSDYFAEGEKKNLGGTVESIDGTLYVPCGFFENEFDKTVTETDTGLIFITDKNTDISSVLGDSTILAEWNEKLK